MKKVLCLIAIGEKYKKVLEKNASQFSAYAKKCGAELVIINEPLDKTMKRSVLTQKLLIPSYLENYDRVVFFDLDVVISDKCPSLFDVLPDNMGLAAVFTPRTSEKFIAHYTVYAPRVLSETPETYFTDRNFPPVAGLENSINGGVLVFNPSKIGHLFKEYYFSDHDQGKYNAFEEAPMAYISQSKKLFIALDENYNRQFFYEFYTQKGEKIRKTKANKMYKIINNGLEKFFKTPYDFLLTEKLQELKKYLINEEGVFILHFAGKSLPLLYTEDLFFL